MSIFVIDDHPLMREAIAALIRRLSPTANVVELDRLAAVSEAAATQGTPNFITLEWLLPDGQGMSSVRELRQLFPEVPIIVLSAAPAASNETQALQAGANEYLQKSASAAEIASVVKVFLNATSELAAPTPMEKLSKRQKQLLVLLNKGMSNRDIAESLQISEHTVKVHLWRLFRRINVKSRLQASHMARAQGLF